ncbi:MAG: glycosyl transferase, partial [Nostoc sp.]
AIIAYIFVWMQRRGQSPISVLQNKFNLLQQKWTIWGEWIFLILIVSIGFGLRVYNLGFIDLDPDENTSLDAARGILRTGAPIATSGIWYTRGPFYHYLLALWLRLVGDSIVN